MLRKGSLALLLGTVLLIGALTLLAPPERSLGANVRLVYLHGAWVLTAEVLLLGAAAAGLLGLVLRRQALHRWSGALGRSGMVFWVTYLPLSLLTMQSNWNGLFLAEPRFRLAMTFAIAGALLQTGLWFLHTPVLTSLSNMLFAVALRFALSRAQYVMHPPPSPIFGSGLFGVISYFLILLILACFAGYLLTRLLLEKQS